MNHREESIHRIVEELRQLPEAYLDNVYEIIRTLRSQLPASEIPLEDSSPPAFVDEIEQVQKQSRTIPGRPSDRSFT